ncbi:MAG: hypothetical protein K5768_03920 [Firmicutes bacterium]|nr:hypothetical protein [Bacillota bacterium]
MEGGGQILPAVSPETGAEYRANNREIKNGNRPVTTIFEEEKPKQERLYLDFNKLKSYFPKGYTMKQCEAALWEILDEMMK